MIMFNSFYTFCFNFILITYKFLTFKIVIDNKLAEDVYNESEVNKALEALPQVA